MENKSEQFYPTYQFKPESRDILLLEFEEAQKIANGQSKLYGQVTNILLTILTFSFTFLLGQKEEQNNNSFNFFFSHSILLCSILFIFGAILLRYFVDLQKQITINARKVVTLRTMLGLDYGHIHLTLPNWRVEGATNPFVIKYFNGWLQFKTTPFWLITITINTLFYITVQRNPPLYFNNLTNSPNLIFLLIGHFVITIIYLHIFRKNLNDTHETIYLNIVKIFCSLFRIKLIDNFEYILYRAKLSYLELDRLKVNYLTLRTILVDIEDKCFYEHKGFSLKSLLRGFLSRFEFFRNKFGYIKNGGSTITMQLTRSLFIPTNQNKYLRKIAEILLSKWLDNQFPKNEILKLYIASVRFEKGILGLSSAINYFFETINEKTLTNEEAFFLVERLSNITSTFNKERVKHLTTRTKVSIDLNNLMLIYKYQQINNRLR